MARNKPKQKGPKQSLDESSLAKLTATIGKKLEKPSDDGPSGKRKRQDGGSAPLPKKRQVQAERPAQGMKEGKEKKHSGKLSTRQFLDEIRALGGDEKDLELITGIDSDAEEGASKEKLTEAAVDNSLKNELAKFASSLGFENLPKDDEVQTDEEDAGRGVEQDADNGGEDEDEEEVEMEPEPVKELQKGKKSGKLVSKELWYRIFASPDC